ncbi:MAG: YcxB family protein [Candidatus Micrarchaeaceae archaeon]
MKSPLANADISATFDEHGITISVKGQQKTHWWAGFSQIYESRRVVIFEKSKSEFLSVPKRAMSMAQFDEMRRLATSAPNCKVRLAAPFA